MTHKELPDPELLRKLLRYDPDTGKLFWLPRPVEMFASVGAGKTWNTKHADQEAGSPCDRGYLRIKVYGRMISCHRIAWLLHTGHWPSAEIDHINGNTSDNRIINLRDVLPCVNLRNAKKRLNNTSGKTGVYLHKKSGKWMASIGIGGKLKHIGLYASIDEAIQARAKAEVGLGFTKRHG